MEGPEYTADFATTRAAVRAAADACGALFASAPDGGVALPGSDWNVGEVAVHVAVATEAYIDYARGKTEAFVDVSDIAGGSLATTSAQRLAEEPERDVDALVARLDAAASELLTATAECDGTEMVTWNGHEIPVGSMLGIALGEYLLHGRDVAHALGRPAVAVAPVFTGKLAVWGRKPWLGARLTSYLVAP